MDVITPTHSIRSREERYEFKRTNWKKMSKPESLCTIDKPQEGLEGQQDEERRASGQDCKFRIVISGAMRVLTAKAPTQAVQHRRTSKRACASKTKRDVGLLPPAWRHIFPFILKRLSDAFCRSPWGEGRVVLVFNTPAGLVRRRLPKAVECFGTERDRFEFWSFSTRESLRKGFCVGFFVHVRHVVE